MLSQNQKNKLLANWGDKAQAMDCNAEVRIYNTLPDWECYLYAMNPDDEDTVSIVWHGMNIETHEWNLRDIMQIFNREGEYPLIDKEFVPRQASEIYKKLVKDYGN